VNFHYLLLALAIVVRVGWLPLKRFLRLRAIPDEMG
jgi:hypothetical protein